MGHFRNSKQSAKKEKKASARKAKKLEEREEFDLGSLNFICKLGWLKGLGTFGWVSDATCTVCPHLRPSFEGCFVLGKGSW